MSIKLMKFQFYTDSMDVLSILYLKLSVTENIDGYNRYL